MELESVDSLTALLFSTYKTAVPAANALAEQDLKNAARSRDPVEHVVVLVEGPSIRIDIERQHVVLFAVTRRKRASCASGLIIFTELLVV